jgi:hypothetical protein
MSELDNKVDRWDHDDLQQQVWELSRQVEKLTERLEKLEQPLPVYLAPHLLDSVKCVKCGMTWTGVMGYVCQDNDCPIQMKVTC